MLAVLIVKILGFAALGAFIGILAIPFILYLLQVIAYILALVMVLLWATLTLRITAKKALQLFPQFLKKSQQYTDKPIYDGKNGKASINYPNPVKRIRQLMIDGSIVGVKRQSEAQQGGKTDYRPDNQGVFDTPKQPIVKPILNTICNFFHSLLLFHRSYYCQSI